MLFNPRHGDRSDQLADQLRLAHSLTRDLISNVISDACAYVPALNRSETTARIDQFLDAGAWCDAALALTELQFPPWKLRRLVYEDGEWYCSLTSEPRLPYALDEVAEASHEILALAILLALLEARHAAAANATSVTTAPQVHPAAGYPVCCDNFA